MNKNVTLCKIKKSDYQQYEDKIIKIVKNPLFICKKCLRVANDKKYLCKGKDIKT